MSAPRTGRRGSYAKGLAKREEILTRALDVISQEGYAGASVKAIAEAVGLSQAGLLHYFDSKEELFTEVLRKRDEVDALSRASGADAPSLEQLRTDLVALVRHNTAVPGLVQLFSRLAADATDPAHPAHEFFLERSARLREVLDAALARAQADGRLSDRIDSAALARMVQALADGMQLQWLVDPTVDMIAPLEALFALLQPVSPGEPDVDQRSGATEA